MKEYLFTYENQHGFLEEKIVEGKTFGEALCNFWLFSRDESSIKIIELIEDKTKISGNVDLRINLRETRKNNQYLIRESKMKEYLIEYQDEHRCLRDKKVKGNNLSEALHNFWLCTTINDESVIKEIKLIEDKTKISLDLAIQTLTEIQSYEKLFNHHQLVTKTLEEIKKIMG